jgi:hypothetical protein
MTFLIPTIESYSCEDINEIIVYGACTSQGPFICGCYSTDCKGHMPTYTSEKCK